MYLNQFTCAGNLTADPVLHCTRTERYWVSCGVALNKPIPPRDGGEWSSEVHFVDWTAWGKLAQRCAGRLHKGDGVLLVGELRQERWEDKDTGAKREKHRLVARNVQRYRVAKGKKDEPEVPEDLDAPGDDIPF